LERRVIVPIRVKGDGLPILEPIHDLSIVWVQLKVAGGIFWQVDCLV
jgi:hypothetical protein